MTDYIVPCILLIAVTAALHKKENAYDLMLEGAAEGLKLLVSILPALILLAIFTYYPVAKLVQISFTDWNLLKPTWNYVGLKNWNWLFNGSGAKYLWNSLKVTFVYTMGEISVTIIGGMIFALLFNRATKGFTLMRAVVFVPKYVAMSSCAVVFLWILNTDYGVMNYLLKALGMQPVDWLNQKETAMISVLMTTCWRVVGYGMMIYMAAMKGISPQYYEASAIDGANKVQQFFGITLPLLAPMSEVAGRLSIQNGAKLLCSRFGSIDAVMGVIRSLEFFINPQPTVPFGGAEHLIIHIQVIA